MFQINDLTYKIQKHSGRTKKSRLYVTVHGKTPFHKLPYPERKELYRRAARLLLDQHTQFKALRGVKLSWSEKCGCACGCSPGFILKQEDSSNIDIFVTVTVEKKVDEWEEAKNAEPATLDASTLVCSVEEFKNMLRDNGWSMDGEFKLHDPTQVYPVGCVEITDGVVFMFLNPIPA